MKRFLARVLVGVSFESKESTGMKKRFKVFLPLICLVILISAGILTRGLLAGHAQNTARPFTTSARPATPRLFSHHVVDVQKIPGQVEVVTITKPSPGAETEDDQPGLQQLQKRADHNPNAPASSSRYTFTRTSPTAQTTGGTFATNALSASAFSTSTSSGSALTTSFQGMTDTNSICPPTGCQTPDQALAVSPNWVFQGVNTSFAVYNTAGVLQAGWPKAAQSFFNIPNTPNGCSLVPYLIDVRAFYDPNDGRFWAMIMQNEDAFGHDTSCPFQALYWVAVSQTSNPNGLWNTYSFDMSLGTTNGVDFAQFGFDAQAVYISGNMFNQSGQKFQYAEIFALNKSLMESGASVTPHGFTNLKLNNVAVDTVQPVESETRTNGGASAGLFINSLNYNFGGGSCINSCTGIVVWAMANPLSTTPSLTSSFISNTLSYAFPARATQPGCSNCIDTDETQILATPTYSNGLITFALNTGVNVNNQTVPGILWGQVAPVLTNTGILVSASIYQNGYFNYQDGTGAYYGALMTDGDGNLYMVFDASSSTVNPQVSFVERPVAYTPGLFQDGGQTLRVGNASTIEYLWGDFDAASYDGFTTNDVWVAGEYAPANGYWSTYIGELTLVPDMTLPPTPTPTPTTGLTPTPTPHLSAYSNAILKDHPVAYYRLDETGGTTAYDISGNGHNGTYTSNVTLNQSGAISDGDAAITCNGQSMTQGGGSSLPSGASARSVEFWFKTTATPSSPYGSALVTWGTESGTEMFSAKLASSTQLKLSNWTTGYYFTLPSGANALDGKWHYVVITFDGSNTAAYYDGQNLGSQGATFNTVLNTTGLVLCSQTSAVNSPFVGGVDEVAVYNQALTLAQVQAHYSAH
jgi:hypothetical protein